MDGTFGQTDKQPGRPAKMTWLGMALVAGLCFIYLLWRPSIRDDRGKASPAVGRKLMALSLVPLTGDSRPVSLTDLTGKTVLINYWGTWCPPCLVEFPHIVELERKYHDRPGFRLLSVSCGSGPREDLTQLARDTRAHLDRYHAEMPTYADPQGFSRQSLMVTADMSSFGLPTTVLIDGQGTIRGLWVGYRSGVESEMDELIDELLGESAPGSTT